MNYRVFGALVLAGGITVAQTQPSGEAEQENKPMRYEGPSILSRDRSLIGERGGKLLDYRFYVDVTGAFDSSLIPVSTNSSGGLNTTAGAYSVNLGGGITGSRTWRHDQLSLDYTGDVRHYPGVTYYDGTDQFLNLSYVHQFSRRLSLQTRNSAGTTYYSNGYFTYLPLQQTDLYAVPTNELFDNRTDFLQSRVDATWQKTVRLSLNFGGEGFLVRRRSISLASLNGFNAHGDISYRLTKRQTVTASYQHTSFNYARQYGDANIDQYSLGYSIGLGRRWDFGSQYGIGRVEFRGLTIVNVDPAIAAIVGQSTSVVAFHRISYIPIYEAQLTRRFERSAVTGAYNQSFSPGNGVYLASRQTAATITYSYTGLRKLALEANGGYSKLVSLGQTLGTFQGETLGVGATYNLRSYTHVELRYDYRHYTTGSAAGYKQNSHRISIGLAFSPGKRPLPIW